MYLYFSEQEECHAIIDALNKNNLSYVPLVTPATKSERIARLAKLATGFVYVVSVSGAKYKFHVTAYA